MTGLSRRNALRMGCAGLFFTCSAGMVRAAKRPEQLPEGDAYAPWVMWDLPSIRGTPFSLVAAAILAANPHDTQPWLFHVQNDRIDVFADLSRNLGAMDAFVREMHLGIGCAMENALLAAGPNGFVAELETMEGSLSDLAERKMPVHAATIHLARQDPRLVDPLYRAIPKRHTNRNIYVREKPLPRDWLDFVANSGTHGDVRLCLYFDGRDRRLFDGLVDEATSAIIADSKMIADSDRWLRTSQVEIERHRDGPTLEAAGLSPFTLAFAKLFPVSPEISHRAWLDHTRETLDSAPVTGLIAVRNRYDRETAIEAGRIWQRLHLSATVRGIAMQPLNQPIEMIDRRRQIGGRDEWAERLARLTGDDWQATFSFRAGYATRDAPASPRRRLKDVLL